MIKLHQLLKYISYNNDYYKKIISKYGITNNIDIRQYPILSRKTLQINRYNMFSDGYKAKYFNQQLLRQASSGTTGTPISVYWDYSDWYSSNMALWRKRLKWYNIKPTDKCIIFTLDAFGSNGAIEVKQRIYVKNSIMNVNISLMNSESALFELIKTINEFNPTWFYIQPHILQKIIFSYETNKVQKPKNLRYIESVGELLTNELKNKAANFFGVDIANMYGSEEMNGIAYECPYHNMHILDDNVFVETYRDGVFTQYGCGTSVITSLNNKAMPLIRYYQGDIIETESLIEPCKCGCSSPVISIIKGRETNCFFIGKTEMSAASLFEAIAEVNNNYSDAIGEYNFIFHKARNVLHCFININKEKKGWESSIKEELESTLLRKLPCEAPIKVEIFTKMPGDASNEKYEIFKIQD